MQCIILTGSEVKRKNYLESYIKDNAINIINIVRFDQKLKISDAREIKKSISIKQNDKKLIIISSDITIDAQNTLLKTLEEIPQNFTIIFSLPAKELLLSTIISRCFIVNAGMDEDFIDSTEVEEYKKMVFDLLDSMHGSNKSMHLYNMLRLSEKAERSGKSDTIENLILAVRVIIRQSILETTKYSSGSYIVFLSDLIYRIEDVYISRKNNNLNKRLVIEKILFDLCFNLQLS